MNNEIYSSRPERDAYLLMDGMTVYVLGVEEFFHNDLSQNFKVVHVLIE